MPGVYAIVNKVNGRVYVGSTTRSLKRRWIEHRRDLRYARHPNRYLQFSWNKHGEEAFLFVILVRTRGVDEAIKLEQEWLDFFRFGGEVYNFGKVAKCPMQGLAVSDETKRKLSLANKGRVFSEEHKRRISQAKTGTVRAPLSEERKQQLSRLNKGKQLSEEHKRKIAESVKRSWSFRERTSAAARPYPSFYNVRTGECIPAGVNLAALCRQRGLSYTTMKKVRTGKSCNGWTTGEANAVRKSA